YPNGSGNATIGGDNTYPGSRTHEPWPRPTTTTDPRRPPQRRTLAVGGRPDPTPSPGRRQPGGQGGNPSGRPNPGQAWRPAQRRPRHGGAAMARAVAGGVLAPRSGLADANRRR